MNMYKREFALEQPFTVEYKTVYEENGFYIELVKYEKGIEIQRERRFVGKDKVKCNNILEALYKNSVTPMHLNCIIEDIF